MAKSKNKELIGIIEENIAKIENKEFTVYFFIIDTKGNPSGNVEYTYQLALQLSHLGYNVVMLHNEKDFIGVEEWLGSEYANLPHKNIEKENVEISAADFLFIPEYNLDAAVQTKELPCKRVLIAYNFDHVCDFMPITANMEILKIHDVITTTKVQEGILKTYFPEVKTHVVSPSINEVFSDNGDKPQNLVVNIVAKNQSDINRIVKPFFWKNPLYKWVSFRDLRGFSQEAFAEALRTGAITIWIDDSTPFGLSALEAMRSGTILLAKTPIRLTDWMITHTDDGGIDLTDACLWFESLDSLPDMIVSIVRNWTLDQIPHEIYDKQKLMNGRYTKETQAKEIEMVFGNEIFKQRAEDYKVVVSALKKK